MKLILVFLLAFFSISSFANLIYWPYELEGCMNFKDQFLIKSISKGSPSFEKVNKQKCHVKGGAWEDIFTGEVITKAEDVIVAPIIPLQMLEVENASFGIRKIYNFAHDQDVLITFKKGGEGERMYFDNIEYLKHLPKDSISSCHFVATWLDAKAKAGIKLSRQEIELGENYAVSCTEGSVYVGNRELLFGHWMKLDGSDCNTRVQVLRNYSYNKNYTTECELDWSDKWFDSYTNKVFTSANELQIDHVVPLKNAYFSGAWMWPRWKRVLYTNFQLDPFHLMPVHYFENISKGEKHPGKYMPPNQDFHCEYVGQWIAIKLRWMLAIDLDERDFILSKIPSCTNLDQEKHPAIVHMLARLKH